MDQRKPIAARTSESTPITVITALATTLESHARARSYSAVTFCVVAGNLDYTHARSTNGATSAARKTA